MSKCVCVMLTCAPIGTSGYMIDLFLGVVFFYFCESSLLISIVARLVYITTYSVQKSPCDSHLNQHLLLFLVLRIDTLLEVRWKLTDVLNCISGMTDEEECIYYMCLLAICIS